MGTGTTNLAAAKWGRNSIGIEVDPHYYELARKRLSRDAQTMFCETVIECVDLENGNEEPSDETCKSDKVLLGS